MHLYQFGSPRKRTETGIWVQELYLENNPRNKGKDMGTERWKRRELIKDNN